MKALLKSEEIVLFLFGIFLFTQLHYAWWWFPLLLPLPDIGMLGYLFNERLGAQLYNLFHHRGLALALFLAGVFLSVPLWQLAGVILFAHVAMDRALGYGLKYKRGFKYTHLGEIGKNNG